jgi:hypothetical protein
MHPSVPTGPSKPAAGGKTFHYRLAHSCSCAPIPHGRKDTHHGHGNFTSVQHPLPPVSLFLHFRVLCQVFEIIRDSLFSPKRTCYSRQQALGAGRRYDVVWSDKTAPC